MLVCSSICLSCPNSTAPLLQVARGNLGWVPAKPACRCSVAQTPGGCQQCRAGAGALCKAEALLLFPWDGCNMERNSLHRTRCPQQSQGQICKPRASAVCKIELCICNVLLKTCLSYRSLNISKYIPTEQSMCLNLPCMGGLSEADRPRSERPEPCCHRWPHQTLLVTDLISILETSQVFTPSCCREAFLSFQTKGQFKLICSHANVTGLL